MATYICECPGRPEGNRHGRSTISKIIPLPEYQILAKESAYAEAQEGVLIVRRDCPKLYLMKYDILALTETCQLIRVLNSAPRRVEFRKQEATP